MSLSRFINPIRFNACRGFLVPRITNTNELIPLALAVGFAAFILAVTVGRIPWRKTDFKFVTGKSMCETLEMLENPRSVKYIQIHEKYEKFPELLRLLKEMQKAEEDLEKACDS